MSAVPEGCPWCLELPSLPLVGVLALQGDVREHVRALERSGARAVPVRRPAELEAVDGLVIPGGESTTLWRLAVSFDMLEPMRKMLSAACRRSAPARA